MSDSDKTIEDLASQYLDLWQKQLSSQLSEKTIADTIAVANQMNDGAQEFLKSLDTPEKSQEWVTTWADSWKAQFNNATKQQNPSDPTGPAPASPTPQHSEHGVDDLTRRIALLEERVQQLESKPKD